MRSQPNLATFLECIRARHGLYLLGAGASAGEVPFGNGFEHAPLIDFLRHAGSFSVIRPEETPLTRRLLGKAREINDFDVHGRTLRPGAEDLAPGQSRLMQELLHLMPGPFARSHLMHGLAAPRYRRRRSHNYLPFRFSPPSLFMNYNHDGLATDLLRDIHRVIPVHGTVEAWIGSPEAREFILTAGVDYGLAISTDRLLMLEPESYCDADLERRLSAMVRVKPEFVAIIGYTFARTNCGHDDAVSLDCFVDHYREFRGPVFVVDPAPEPLQELLAQRLRVAHVVGLPVRWNLLAHAFLKALAGRLYGQTLGDHCKALLDAGHEWSAYPLAVDLNGEAPAR